MSVFLLFEARRMTGDDLDAPSLFAPTNHEVLPKDVNLDRLERIVREVHEEHPQDFASLLGSKGVGPATVRALSLLAELIYDAPASHRDPADSPKQIAKLPPVLEHLPIDAVRIGHLDGDLYDPRNAWSRQRQIGSDGAVLVRPDRFIACRYPTAVDYPRAALVDVLGQVLGRRQ